MKRFQYIPSTGQVKKIDKKILIKERIEFGRDLLSPALKDQTNRPVQYQLTGIVLHHGIRRRFLYDVPAFGPQIWEYGNFSVNKRIFPL